MAIPTARMRSTHRYALLTLALLAALTGCGPGPADDATSPASHALNPAPVPDQKETPVPMPEQLVLPQWIAQALEAPDVRVRLRALDRWAQQGPEAPRDPLVVARDDKDDDVRTKAMALIERQWAVAQEAEPKAAP